MLKIIKARLLAALCPHLKKRHVGTQIGVEYGHYEEAITVTTLHFRCCHCRKHLKAPAALGSSRGQSGSDSPPEV